MAHASEAPPTVDPREAEHFGRLADDWWDPRGSSAMLHRLNPARLAYIRDRIDQHWQLDEHDLRPLAGRSAADIGCGAGLIAEPLARLGARVTAIDAAAENIEAAREHARGQGLAIDYRVGGVEQLDAKYDLIVSLEVIEHVADVSAFVAGLAGALADEGLLILSTPNRTQWSRLVLITIGEGTGLVPRGTHDFDKLLTPEEMRGMLEAHGLRVDDLTGLSWNPARGFVLTEDLSLNYLASVTKA